jgi:hypothetical protein
MQLTRTDLIADTPPSFCHAPEADGAVACCSDVTTCRGVCGGAACALDENGVYSPSHASACCVDEIFRSAPLCDAEHAGASGDSACVLVPRTPPCTVLPSGVLVCCRDDECGGECAHAACGDEIGGIDKCWYDSATDVFHIVASLYRLILKCMFCSSLVVIKLKSIKSIAS